MQSITVRKKLLGIMVGTLIPMLATAELSNVNLPEKQVMWVSTNDPAIIPDKLYMYKQGDHRGLKDKAGKIIYPANYLGFESISEGFNISKDRILVIQSTGIALGDAHGNLITPPKYGYILNGFSQQGTTTFSYQNVLQEGVKFGVMNRDGKEIIPPMYDSIGSFVDGYAWVIDGKYEKIIDLSGNVHWQLPQDWHTSHENYGKGNVVVQNTDKQYALYSVNGQEVIGFDRYSHLSPQGNFLHTEQNGRYGVADLTTGKEIVPAKFDEPIGIASDYTELSGQANGKYYRFDATGKQIEVRSADFAKQCQHVHIGAMHKKRKQYRVRSFSAEENRVEFYKGEQPLIDGAHEADSAIHGHCNDVAKGK